MGPGDAAAGLVLTVTVRGLVPMGWAPNLLLAVSPCPASARWCDRA